MPGKQKEPDRFGAVLGQDFPQTEKIAQGLRHLLAVERDKPVMNPVPREGLARAPFRLCDLVLMVREYQVLAPAVDIEGLAQVFAGHDRAFDVPPGAALAPGRVPGGFSRLGFLPQGEIQGIFLALVHFHPRARFQIVQGPFGQFPIALKLPHAVIDVPFQNVGQAFDDQVFDKADDLGNDLGDAGVMAGALDVQEGHLVEAVLDELFRHSRGRLAGLVRLVDDLVIHVGKVLDVLDLKTLALEKPPDRVEKDVAARVPQVRLIVGRHPADVHFDFPRS